MTHYNYVNTPAYDINRPHKQACIHKLYMDARGLTLKAKPVSDVFLVMPIQSNILVYHTGTPSQRGHAILGLGLAVCRRTGHASQMMLLGTHI